MEIISKRAGRIKNFIYHTAFYSIILIFLIIIIYWVLFLNLILLIMPHYYYITSLQYILMYVRIYISPTLACSRVGSSVKRWKQIVWNNSWREVP